MVEFGFNVEQTSRRVQTRIDFQLHVAYAKCQVSDDQGCSASLALLQKGLKWLYCPPTIGCRL